MDLRAYRIDDDDKVDLRRYATEDDGGITREAAESELAELLEKMLDLQERLFAEKQHSLLVILQGRDASGKDGTIKRVIGGFNPLGTTVVAFKAPHEAERAHDFLWRIHQHAPAAGHVTIFNRSHYEDILVPTVQKLLPKSTITPRYEHIRSFEALLADSGTAIVKFFLHISKEEQRKRLQERLDQPDKRWKFDPHDLDARAAWDDYTDTYEQIFRRTATKSAPWYVVPADRKWYRNYVVAQAIVHALEALDLEYPDPPPGLAGTKIA